MNLIELQEISRSIRDQANALLELVNLRKEGSVEVKTLGTITFNTDQKKALKDQYQTLKNAILTSVGELP